MNSLFCSIFLAYFTFSNSASVRSSNLDWNSDWNWPRKSPRHPPPPFTLPRQFPPLRLRPNNEPDPGTTGNPEDDKSVILYKLQCDPCLPGWGVKWMCNSTTNTVCTPCPLGTWSPRTHHYRPCTPCKKCGEGSYEEAPCTGTQDAVCCSCGNANAEVNEDYVRKCVLDSDASTDIELYNVEVIDLKSREFDMDKSDASDEFGFNADDIDRPFLWLPPKGKEIDISIDDPEIDSDLNTNEESKPEEKNEENESEPIQILLHPIRPLPQMVPAPETNIHVDPDADQSDPTENNFPPSYHDYSISSLVHGGDAQRRKAIVLLVLTSAIVLSTVAFVVCYVREYCRRRSVTYRGVAVVNLTTEEREIVRKSANVLDQLEKHQTKPRGNYSPMRNDQVVYVMENPLEDYLNTIDDGRVAREGLIENEVLNEPIDRKTTSN